MSECNKHGGPNDWNEARQGLKRRKKKINQRNQQIWDLKGRIKNLQSELSSCKQQSNSWAEAATKANERVRELEKELKKIDDHR